MSRSRHHPGALEAPLPATLEEALEHVLYLRSALIRERERTGKIVEMRERDRRSLSGQLAALRRELATLRTAPPEELLERVLKEAS